MKVSRNSAICATVSGLALLAATGPSLALDANAFADALKANLAKQGLNVTFASVEGSGSSVTLKGVGIGIPGEDAAFPAGTLTAENVEEADGGYRVGKASLADIAFSDSEFSFLAEGMSFEGLRIPAEGASGPFGNMMLYERAQVAAMSVTIGGSDVFSMENLNANIDIPASADEKMLFDAGMDRMFINFAAVPEPEAQQTMTALGYETMTGNFVSKGYWIASSGRMAFDENRFSIDDAASINIALDIDGYTPEFVSALQEMQVKMQESGGDDQAQGLAMLGLLQQLNLHSAAIRLEDASLTGKVLDFLAAQQGTNRENLINQAKGILPFMLAQLGNPDFAAQITQAASAYLDNPQSLEINAAPAAPVPFAQLMATGMTAPQTLPDALSVTVTANQ